MFLYLFIRNEDISLFNQLTGYTEFTKNPLDILKKHFTK